MSPISEDELRARLRSVEPSPAQSGFAEHLSHQGRFRRRRQRWVTGIAAAAAVAVIGGGALLISDQLGPETALPATPTPTATRPEVTPTVTSTRSPTVTTTPSPTNTPATTGTPSPSGSMPSSSPTPSSSVQLLPVELLHQDAAAKGGVVIPGENTEWRATSDIYGFCEQGLDSMAAQNGLTDLRAISATVDTEATMEAVLLFKTASGASAFMGEFQSQGRQCPDNMSQEHRGVEQILWGPWEEGIAVSASSAPDHSNEFRAGVVIYAVRVGSAITLAAEATQGFVENPTGASDSRLRPAVEHVARQLCRYTEAGC